jgi:hypothetical protein
MNSHSQDCSIINTIISIYSSFNPQHTVDVACHRSLSRYLPRPLRLTLRPRLLRAILDAVPVAGLRIVVTAVVLNCDYKVHATKWLACPQQTEICIQRHLICDGVNNCGIIHCLFIIFIVYFMCVRGRAWVCTSSATT